MMNSTVIIGSIDYLGKSSWLSILAFVIGIIGIFIGIYTLLDKKEKLPHYAITSNNIIRDYVSMFKLLDIKYSDQEIKNFTITKIAFWNKGRETISKEDVVKSDPISIRVKEGYNILDKEIIGTNEDTNNFSLQESVDKSSVDINFDYIDKNNGIVIQILHTGKSSDDIEFCGRIKGVGKAILCDVKTKERHFRLAGLALAIFFEFIIIIYLYIFGAIFLSRPWSPIFFVIIVSSPIILSRLIAHRLYSMPKGLEAFNQDITDHVKGKKRYRIEYLKKKW